MDSNQLVSVIIPVYNVASYLREALDSVIHQTYTNLEIIIIDDGSTDGSGRICDEYAGKDCRIRLIHQENMGLSAARNAGLDIMTGDVIAFLDSDDAYCPEYIEIMLAAMNRENADIAACRIIVYETVGKMNETGDGKTSLRIQQGKYDRINALRALADKKINQGIWNKIYRKELWKDIRFPEGYVYEDIAVTYQLINLCQKVYILDRPLYMYRRRAGSISDIKSSKNIKDYFTARSYFERFIRDNVPGIYTDEQLKRYCRNSFFLRLRRYADYSPNSEENGKEFRKEMRRQIAGAGESIRVGESSLRMRICCRMAGCFPRLMNTACSVYRFFRKRVCRT